MTQFEKPAIHADIYDAIDPSRFTGKLKNRVVIVTGSARGIGQAIAIAFAKAGADLAILDLKLENLTETKKLCEAEGAKKVKAYACDVTKEAVVKATVAEIEKDLGPVYAVVNNAGGVSTRPFHMESMERFWYQIELNFKAAMLFSYYLLPGMRERKEGCIINIASRSGTTTHPMCISYNSAKAALIRATACLQAELDVDGLDNIHVYALHPGANKTGLQEEVPADVAAAYPGFAQAYKQFSKLFKCKTRLCGQTCVFLATGEGKAVLKGKYFDCEQDIGTVVAAGPEEIRGPKQLYELKVEFLGGLPNDGGTVPDDALQGKDGFNE